jgi:hypothetical protein
MMMVRSMSRDNDLVIELEDAQFVHQMLLETEDRMPEVFKEMTASGDKRHIVEIHRHVFRHITKNKTDCISEEELVRYIQGKVDVHKARYFLESLVGSGRLKIKGANNAGYRHFIPVEVES